MEEWRPVVGYEGSYEVSNYGRIRSLDRVVERSGLRGPIRRKGQLLRPGSMLRGHLMVVLARHPVTVHKLVARAFIGPRPEGMEVRHLNGDPKDNRVENICYGTTSENRRDRKFHAGKRGCLKADQVREIRKRLAHGYPRKEIAAEFSVGEPAISNIAKGKTHTDV